MIRLGIFIILIGLGLLYVFEMTEEAEEKAERGIEQVEINSQHPENYTEASEELTPREEKKEEKIEVIKGEKTR